MTSLVTTLIVALLSIAGAFAVNRITNARADTPSMFAEIRQIKSIDNHAHVMAGVADQEFDAIACGGLEFVAPPPMRLRVENPIYTGAWKELFGYNSEGKMDEQRVKEYLAIKQRVMKEQGDHYPAWVLDKLNIQTMLANRVRPAKTLAAPRFRWVGYGDPLMLPLSTKTLRETDSDKRFFYAQEEKIFKLYLDQLNDQLDDELNQRPTIKDPRPRTKYLGPKTPEQPQVKDQKPKTEDLVVKQLPVTFDLYLTRIVTPTLERMKREGAVAVKFVAAYLRPLNFEKTTQSAAARIYARYRVGGEPSWNEYKQLQDFVFRYIAMEAGRLGLVVHIHTGGGCGHFFNLSNGNPLLLESVVNDPSLRKTNFVLIHGGYPFTRETEFLLEKPNVYADFSAQTFLLTPAALSRVLRSMLEYEPEKVLFGTDASPATPEVSWEESAWMTNKTAREALAIALEGMMKDEDVSRERALELARMVLHDNASKLYGL